MLSSISFMFDTYWTIWSSLFPYLPFWSPHGAVMTPIIAAAVGVLAGKFCWHVFRRT